MVDEQRIQQFRQMAEADPENELGQFSLGKALVDAGQFDESVTPLTRAIDLNSRMSKAYQLLGEALRKTSQNEKAVEVMKKGITIADELGDRMPRDAMVALMKEWGEDVPELSDKPTMSASPTGGAPSGDGFQCARCGRPNGRLAKPPFKGELGGKIAEHVCDGCWREWIPTGTKVINELGLVLSSQAGQDAYDQYMVEFLQLDRV